MNEYFIAHGKSGRMMVYYCPFCGGSTPKSRRSLLFHTLTDAERHRLINLTKKMRTLQDVTAVFGDPDIKQPVGMVITKPEREGKPETTQSCPVMIYRKVSVIADVYVTVYPGDGVGISFRGKPVKENEG